MNDIGSTYFLTQVHQCTALCSSPADLKIVVVPEIAAATALRGALAKQGRGLINIEIVTPSGLARHIWRAVHPERSFKFIHRTEAEFVLGMLTEELDVSLRSLFSSSITYIYRALIEDRLATPVVENSTLSAGSEVQRALFDLRLRYERFLQLHDRLDEVDVLFEASESTAEFLAQRQLKLLLVDELIPLNQQEKLLINGLKVHVEHALLLGSGLVEGSFDVSWQRAAIPLHVNAPLEPEILISSTRREEVRAAIADVLERNIPFDQIEFACTDYPSYLTEIGSALERFHIPWQTSARGSKLERTVQLLLKGFSEWCASGFDFAIIVRMIREKTLDVSDFEHESGEIARAIEAFPFSITLFRSASTWEYALERARDRGLKRSNIFALKKFGEALLPSVPGSACSFNDFKEAFTLFLEAFVPGELDGQAFQNFWSSQFSFSDPSNQLVSSRQWIASRVVSSLQSPVEHHDTGISILPLSQAGYGSAQRVYLFGMDDQAASDSRQLADESSHVTGTLSTTQMPQDGNIPKRKRVKELHRRYGGRLVLCAPTYDVALDRPLFPSSAFIELTGTSSLSPAQRTGGLDLSDHLSRLSSRSNGEENERVRNQIYDAFQPLNNGRVAIQNRSSSEWTVFDGIVHTPTDWKLSHISPSGLEELSTCPFRFFLSRIIRVSAPETSMDSWLTPREEGSLVHAVFEQFVRPRINKGGELPDTALLDLIQHLKTGLDRYSALSSGKIDAQVNRKMRMLKVSAALFVSREKEIENERIPRAVEYTFGEYEEADAPPYILQLDGGNVRLNGRIDRVDQNSDGSFVITDYKTGRHQGYSPKELKDLTRHLQWAIYSLAMNAHLEAAVTSFEYFFPSSRGGGIVRTVAAPALNEVKPVLERLATTYNRGGFIQAADEDPCTYCEFKTVCGDLKQRKEELKQKFWAEDKGPSHVDAGTESWSSILEDWSFRSKMGEDPR